MSRNQKRIWLVQKRVEKELTQIELGKLVNVSNRTISEIERGNRNPSGKLARKIANVLQFDMELFFNDDEEIA